MKARELTVGGITDTIAGWAKRNGVNQATIRFRLANGSSEEEAVMTKEDAVIERRKKKMLRELWHGRWVYTE